MTGDGRANGGPASGDPLIPSSPVAPGPLIPSSPVAPGMVSPSSPVAPSMVIRTSPVAAGGVAGDEPVVLDAMGGDHGPGETVAGAVDAWRAHGVPVVLVGRAPELERELARHGADLPIVHAPDVVPMSERGASGRGGPATSLTVGCDLVRRQEGGAFVSAGSTGAVVSEAVRAIGRAPGVLRPALAVALPALTGGASVLVDAGATADPTPQMMAQFALLGTGYARAVLGVPDPVAGLLSIGSEPGKGNRLAVRASQALQRLPLRFHGNVEGHDVLTGLVDVIVTDGFTGNVVLKNVEGCVRTALTMVAQAGIAEPGRLSEVARRYDPQTHGGAALLGLRSVVVIAHGSSTAATISRACVVACALARENLAARIAVAAVEPV
ncbi:glycerol-3-phosphate acyltransferase PlsX [Nonomuraea thailandensis]|uniref:Phosphate acyltransferase n=1 Tax=Nonomuraea thailandensis TaxID=1188745 RepID=A0A9X2K609_9ACTN|nr:phosphate acyltransferase PlsX [Nonomuraea thailandensis]MCP2358181.1 glycerol-3-phosphate acyltransferase PlsX [Nonomuraea thailandensis]